VEVTDPYALEVSDDEWDNAILRVKGGRRQWVDYNWKHDDVSLPTNDKLIIYELHIADFTGTHEQTGTFRGAIEKLDYLKDLGVNCIELMPVKEFPGRGWGYSLKSLFGVENSYGTPEELCELVDEMHARGMRAIIGGVYNHAHMDAPLARINYEYWFHKENPDGPDMDWGPKYNYDHFDEVYGIFPARKYVIDSILFWVEKFHIDGIRFDATRAIRNFEVLKELADAAYSKVEDRKPFICIAEHVPEDPEVAGRDRGRPMDAAWHDQLGHVLQAVIAGVERHGCHPHDLDKLLERLDPKSNGYESAFRTITFVGNHDHKRPMHVIGEEGKKFGEHAFRRMKLGHGLLLAAPGIPMIWMGSEFGMPSDKSLDPCPVDWSLLQNDDNKELLEFHRRLIHLRRGTPCLMNESFECIWRDDERAAFAFKRWDDAGGVVVVLANLKDDPAGEVEVPLEGIDDGAWRDVLQGGEFAVEGGVLRRLLGAAEIQVFVKV
jgi:1,4-alpha-glucan branching enzyme